MIFDMIAIIFMCIPRYGTFTRDLVLYNNIYVKLHNVVGVTLNYNKKVIIYMNIQMSIAMVLDIKANVQWYLR